ncbi:MAG: ATPase domain-containing protein [Candidatus Aenigmarchaeota archaeon]|nr:AAA family ATPase [Candidatus Aenigmarchaeota archaeon]MDW8149583.1 ATPase domain-containing protein [Candidatus Aenigmarchaeota archaeon]
MTNRVKSGIPGLDQLIEGGFVEGSCILLAGQTGTGKTIFGCQFLLEGAKSGERCFYLSLEESPEDIVNDVKRFTWGNEFQRFVENKTIQIEFLMPSDIKELSSYIKNVVGSGNIRRFVLDNLSVAMMGWSESSLEIGKIRADVFNLFKMLKSKKITSLILVEIPEERTRAVSRFGFEEFIADSVIILNYLEFGTGTSVRSLLIRKMRRTKHAVDIFPFQISDEGIKISYSKPI